MASQGGAKSPISPIVIVGKEIDEHGAVSTASAVSCVDLSSLDPQSMLPLHHGTHVETVLSKYGKSIQELNLAHWGVIDATDMQLMNILHSHGFWQSVAGNLEASNSRCPIGLSQISVPAWLQSYMSLYDQVKNIDDFKRVNRTAQIDLHPAENIFEVCFLKRWIDRCYEHILSLLMDSHGLLHQILYEGVWEGIYWNILDLCFLNLSDIVIQRGDIQLNAMEMSPLVHARHRFDGIIRTRELSWILPPLEFGAIVVSRAFEGVLGGATKWNNDMAKLYMGCLSILKDLKRAVHDDPVAVSHLAAVGILQAGPCTMVLVMRCLGPNLFFLRRGPKLHIPTQIERLHSLSSVLCTIWLARVCHLPAIYSLPNKEQGIQVNKIG